MNNPRNTTIKAHQIICPKCGAKMVLRETRKFLTKDGKPRLFYGCSRYPNCDATHGAHPDGHPLGIPGNETVKSLRMEIHRLLDQTWGTWSTLDRKQKNDIYAWMREHAPKNHVGEMNESELLETKRILIDKLKEAES